MASFNDLAAKVAQLSNIEDSVITLLTGISQQLKDVIANGGTPAQFQALADDIDAQMAKLSKAVIDNTVPTTTTTAPPVNDVP